MTGRYVFRASWPILRPGVGHSDLIDEARADLKAVAYASDAQLTGPAVVWVDVDANRVRAEAPAKPRRIRRRDDAPGVAA